MQTCTSPNDKSCMKKWWKVVKWGDIYYNVGCSSNDPKAEVITDKVIVDSISS